MATRNITFSAGTSYVMTTSFTNMHIFIELNILSKFKKVFDKRDHFIINLFNPPKALLINFIWNDQSCKIL